MLSSPPPPPDPPILSLSWELRRVLIHSRKAHYHCTLLLFLLFWSAFPPPPPSAGLLPSKQYPCCHKYMCHLFKSEFCMRKMHYFLILSPLLPIHSLFLPPPLGSSPPSPLRFYALCKPCISNPAHWLWSLSLSQLLSLTVSNNRYYISRNDRDNICVLKSI